ncbi:MAG TPA: response regulator [Gemmatimonadales bacterium]|nr:response regulator [Gemmatimonadales bacterium]
MAEDLLLIAEDWQSRALVLAELQEAGYEVNAQAGLRQALNHLAGNPEPAPLVLLDLHGDEFATPETVDALLHLVPKAKLVLIVGVYAEPVWDRFARKGNVVLRRPVSVGEIVAEVRRILPR